MRRLWLAGRNYGWLLALVAVLLAWAWAAFAPQPVSNPLEPVARALNPEPGVVAQSLCDKGQLTVKQTLIPQHNYYEATSISGDTRYDLTWQEGGNAIAVERTQGRKFDIWSEDVTPEFLACVANHQITIKEGTH